MAKQRYFYTTENVESVASLDDLRKLWEEYEEDKEACPFPHYVECVQTYNNGIYHEITNSNLSKIIRNYKAFKNPFHICDVTTGEILRDSAELEGKALVCEIDMACFYDDADMIYVYIPQEV